MNFPPPSPTSRSQVVTVTFPAFVAKPTLGLFFTRFLCNAPGPVRVRRTAGAGPAARPTGFFRSCFIPPPNHLLLIMKSLRLALCLAVGALFAASSLIAQPPPRPRASPHEIISGKIDGNRVTIIYGRPYSKDPKSGEIRKIWNDLVPSPKSLAYTGSASAPGKVWRMGSDEATTLITQKDIVIGGLTVPAGAYTLFMAVSDDGSSARLIVNKELGQWGIDPYHPDMELGRVDLKRGEMNTQLDQFTMAVGKNPAGDGGTIWAMWEKTQFTVDFTVKK